MGKKMSWKWTFLIKEKHNKNKHKLWFSIPLICLQSWTLFGICFSLCHLFAGPVSNFVCLDPLWLGIPLQIQSQLLQRKLYPQLSVLLSLFANIGSLLFVVFVFVVVVVITVTSTVKRVKTGSSFSNFSVLLVASVRPIRNPALLIVASFLPQCSDPVRSLYIETSLLPVFCISQEVSFYSSDKWCGMR